MRLVYIDVCQLLLQMTLRRILSGGKFRLSQMLVLQAKELVHKGRRARRQRPRPRIQLSPAGEMPLRRLRLLLGTDGGRGFKTPTYRAARLFPLLSLQL
jgi:hypothetical protein